MSNVGTFERADAAHRGAEPIDVWVLPLRGASPAGRGSTADCSADELQRARRYHHRRDAERFLRARVLYRWVAATYLECSPSRVAFDATCPLCGAPHGMPRPVGLTGGISCSRSGDLLLIAKAAEAVGIDVEIASTQTEQPWPDLRRWVRSEAALKATGHGLSVRPDHITFQDVDGGALATCPHLGDRAWRITDLPVSGHQAAVATPECGKSRAIRWFT